MNLYHLQQGTGYSRPDVINTMSSMVQVLVTEATSPTAYHLLPMLASGDVIQGQSIHVVLCDCTDNQDEVAGVADELQDCAYPMLSSVSLTTNFGEACKSADVIIILPTQIADTGCHGNQELDISYSSLAQIDFKTINDSMYPIDISKTNAQTLRCRGPMSAAATIAECMRQIHVDSLKAMQIENEVGHEEAEFDCPPESYTFQLLPNCDYQFVKMQQEFRSIVLFITSRIINDVSSANDDSIDDLELRDITSITKLYSRL